MAVIKRLHHRKFKGISTLKQADAIKRLTKSKNYFNKQFLQRRCRIFNIRGEPHS